MVPDALEKSRVELLHIREALSTSPETGLAEIESRLESVAAAVASLDGVRTEADRAVLRDVIRVLGDLSALCAQASEFYGRWVAAAGSMAAGYDGSGAASITGLCAARVNARG